ncbi:DUF4230 domain-containing protein [Micromonospora sp. HM5-17]|jgi:hypothetical protein|uniref:DUF4230 domain-containing protein n=1 Tax=Micromonospora sp. HM5-17 TaxID=2487710 RepID=UPI000F483179|nr:DUF4230 domain-containing protein [Micromonospora sp. HM5-17]ROT34044.1 DUF4230 domain-containing protein [Micromonospora sp. HM5-17]
MSRPGDVHQPTREFPEYAKGQATPAPADPWAGAADTERTEPFDAAERPHPDASDSPPPTGGRGRGRGLLILAGIVGLAVALVFGVQASGILPDWRNPFTREETDRSQPPLLKSIQDLSRYVAAEGNFEVVVDLEQNRRYVPDFLLGERTLFVGAGTVEAYVDFGQLGEDAVIVSPDRTSVEVKLPAPQLGQVNLNLERSYVFAEKRGVLNRLGEVFGGDPNRQREVYLKAEQKIAESARSSGLGERAQENTRKMLDQMLRSLGYEQVTITYVQP